MEQRMTDFGVGFIQRAQARHELKPVLPLLLIGIVLGAFTGVVRKAWEYNFPLDAETWSTPSSAPGKRSASRAARIACIRS